MATCGYLCPACEGKGYDENGEACSWCTPFIEGLKVVEITSPEVKPEIQKEIDIKEWIEKVHQGSCCGDL